ncbi:hypothetical protein EYF80_023477 [Liparis tanakae]|uniref:Uncharacterized protein n=1 Tax=Liparis tanakae TaxID=230148 RepID=A0A4Z2HLE2_9TELE|nr:hypothetical protein EYF80_023477 [Liparis tanakae]
MHHSPGFFSAEGVTLYRSVILEPSYLENMASFAKPSSSGATSTILPVRVSRAHLGSSGSYTICLETQEERVTAGAHG